MKESYYILIIEPSYIVKRGLNSIIKNLSKDIILDVFDSYSHFIENDNNTIYDLVLINVSEFCEHAASTGKLFQRFNDSITIGVITTMGRRFILNQLHDVIYINDSEKQIVEILEKNLRKERDNKTANQLLTEREIDVLKLLVKGNTSKEIANKLFISTHTVITHRKNITSKLGIKTTAALAIYAVTAHILDEKDILEDIDNF